LKKSFSSETTCENPNEFEGQFSKTCLFQQPGRREFTLALRQDGTVVAWGDNEYGQTNVPAGLSSVQAVAAGWEHSVALLSNGTVAAWGHNYQDYGWNVTNVPPGLSDVVAISAGGFHTLALRADGTVVAWGAGSTNEQVNFMNALQGQSVVPANLSNVVAISAGGYHSFALKNDGTVVAWGDLGEPSYGQGEFVSIGSGYVHGLAVRAGRLTPFIVQQPSSVVQTNGGNISFTVSAVSLAGVLYQWQLDGVNISGATNATLALTNVGTDDEGDYRVIVSTGAGSVTSSVASFELVRPPEVTNSTPAVSSTTYITNQYFTITVNATALLSGLYPIHYQWFKEGTVVPGATNATFISYAPWTPAWQTNPAEGNYSLDLWNVAGTNHVADWTFRYISVPLPGLVVAWGDDDYDESKYPADLTNAVAIAAGDYHSVGVREDGTAEQWGYYWTGAAFYPVGSAPGYTNLVAVAAGAEHDLGLLTDGTVVSWGLTNADANYVPEGLSGVKAVSAGWYHNLALQTNGTVVVWGSNLFGQTNAPPDLTNITAIAAGAQHSLALRSDGTVIGWGYSPSGQTNVPSDLSNVVAVAAGGMHSLALKADGEVVAWGYNNDGQCNVPEGLSNVMAIAAGWAHSVALKNNGTVVAWGENSSGQTNVVTNLPPVKLIAAGGDHTLAAVFSPLVQYQVDVSKDLLLIYNSTSTNSIIVKDYYLAHRPMVATANVLGLACPTNESITSATFSNQVLVPYLDWLDQNPTKHPQYVIAFLDIPAVVYDEQTNILGSVFYQLHEKTPGIPPFVTCINMRSSNDCKAYIDKLEFFGTNYSPGQLFISASTSGYGNTNYYFDDTEFGYYGTGVAAEGVVGVIHNGASSNSVVYTNVYPDCGSLGCHITRGTNVAGYLSWGGHSALGSQYATNGYIKWFGNSAWWIIATVESYNGQRDNPGTGQGNFLQWFSANAFGGTDYSNTPVGAASHVEEPGAIANDPRLFFGYWEGGKHFAACVWGSRKDRINVIQFVGDPFVIR
jgi:alpha-tubulin suppressor-like RCC1 family protein